MQPHSVTGRDMRIAGIGVHIPPARESNLPLLTGFGVDEEFMRHRIGVVRRATKMPEQLTSDLCIKAFRDLSLKMPDLDVDSIDLVCLVTQNPDSRIPHTSAVIHQNLNLPGSCMTFDLSQGCAGYPHALAVATSLAERFNFNDALVFTCDPYSTIVDASDRDTALLFGDAATVTYIDRRRPGYRLADAAFGTRPGSAAVLRYADGRLVMEGREVFLHAAREVPPAIRRLLERNQLRADEIDLFLLHPGSKYLLDVIRAELGVDQDRLPFEAADYGNTVSSSIPVMLASRLGSLSISSILLCGFGVGFSWGTGLLERVSE